MKLKSAESAFSAASACHAQTVRCQPDEAWSLPENEKRAELGHFLPQKVEPRLWVPDFDADGRSHEHHLAVARHIEELAKTFRDHQPRAVGQSHRSRAGREQPPQPLHLSPLLFHPSG